MIFLNKFYSSFSVSGFVILFLPDEYECILKLDHQSSHTCRSPSQQLGPQVHRWWRTFHCRQGIVIVVSVNDEISVTQMILSNNPCCFNRMGANSKMNCSVISLSHWFQKSFLSLLSCSIALHPQLLLPVLQRFHILYIDCDNKMGIESFSF